MNTVSLEVQVVKELLCFTSQGKRLPRILYSKTCYQKTKEVVQGPLLQLWRHQQFQNSCKGSSREEGYANTAKPQKSEEVYIHSDFLKYLSGCHTV